MINTKEQQQKFDELSDEIRAQLSIEDKELGKMDLVTNLLHNIPTEVYDVVKPYLNEAFDKANIAFEKAKEKINQLMAERDELVYGN